MTAKEMFIGKGIDRAINMALYGATLGGVAANQLSKSKPVDERIKEISLMNPVNASKFVAKHSPGTPIFDIQGEPFYANGIIATPKKANPYALAHEIGHHEYAKTHRPTYWLERFLDIDLLNRKRLKTEEGAWERSPIEIKDEGAEMRDLALEKYKKATKYFRAGAALGTVGGILATIPHLMKHYETKPIQQIFRYYR